MKEFRLPLRNVVAASFLLWFTSWISIHALFKPHATGQSVWGIVAEAFFSAAVFGLFTDINRR
jgi:hypothetical protein